jgi:hypothetical protein
MMLDPDGAIESSARRRSNQLRMTRTIQFGATRSHYRRDVISFTHTSVFCHARDLGSTVKCNIC